MASLKCGMIVALVVVSAMLPGFGQRTPKQQRTSRVGGMWRPESLKSTLNGVTSQPFGPHPDGLLEFNENLHYVECIINPDVPAFAASDPRNATATEIKRAFLGSLSLFGTYTINGKGEFTGNHVDGATIPNWKGNTRDNAHLTEVVNGDTMSEVFHNGDLTVEIMWQRVK